MGDFCIFLSPSCFPYRQYHCILDGSLELDVQTRLDLDSPEIHLPPDLRCAPPCVLTSLLFLSAPPPPCLPNVWSAGLHTCLASSFSLGYIPGVFFLHSFIHFCGPGYWTAWGLEYFWADTSPWASSPVPLTCPVVFYLVRVKILCLGWA